MIDQTIFIGTFTGVAISLFLIGFVIGSLRKKKHILKSEELDFASIKLHNKNENLKQQLDHSIESNENTNQNYLRLREGYVQMQEHLEKLRTENAHLSSHYTKLRQEYGEIITEKTILMQHNYDFKKEIRQLQTDGVLNLQLKAELDNSRTRLTAVHHELEKSGRENVCLIEERKHLVKKVDVFNKISDENRKLTQEFLVLKEKYDKNNELLKSSKKNSESEVRVTALELENNELKLKIELLKRQTKENDKGRAENRKLRLQVNELEILRSKCYELETENASLRIKGLVINKPPKPTQLVPIGGLGKTLENLIHELSCEIDGYRGAVFADDLGLPIAGYGEYADALAGMAAVFSKIEHRIHSLFDFGSLKKLIIVDDNKLTLTIYPVLYLNDKLILTILSVGNEPDTRNIKQLINQVAVSGDN